MAVRGVPLDGRGRKPFTGIIVTLKDRTLSPVVERFLACVREVVLADLSCVSY
jgi:hypothetical protein